MRVTRLNSPSSPEVAEWDVVGAGVVVGGLGKISGEGLLVADGSVASAEPWGFGQELSQVISSLFWVISPWLLISQLHVLAMPLSTPLSSAPCTEEAGFFLDDRRLSL